MTAPRCARRASSHGGQALCLLLLALLVCAGTPVLGQVPVAITVTNLNDSGAGSLRAALATAAGTPAVNVIKFAPALSAQTITLASELVVNDTSGIIIDSTGLAGGITLTDGAGGNRVFNIAAGTPCEMRRLNIVNTTITGADGGGILNAGTLTMVECAVAFCFTNGNGGGIANSGQLTLKQCTVGENRATSPTSEGGGIFSASGSSLTLEHSTITSNHVDTSAGRAGGISNFGVMVSTNCIIAGNNALTSQDIFNGGSVVFGGANIVQTLGGTAATGNAPINAIPNTNNFGNNGGPTLTARLSNLSAARNASVGSTITADQRGKPIVGTADIGSFEVQAGTFTVSPAAVSEGEPAQVTINRGPEASGPVTVRLVTSNGTATAPADYAARLNNPSFDVPFINAETSKAVPIPTVTDFLVEGNHSFNATVSLPAPAVGASIGTPATAAVTIRDPFLVTNVNDDGPGSLRQAIATAKATAGADSIQFAPALSGKTIILGSEIVVDDTQKVTINASNLPAGLTITSVPGSGLSTNRHFTVASGANLTLVSLTLSRGGAVGTFDTGFGGSILVRNSGSLTTNRCSFLNSFAPNNGGAIAVLTGTLQATQCTFNGNFGTNGGAVSSTGTATLTHCTLFFNGALTEGGGFFNDGTMNFSFSIASGNSATNVSASADGKNQSGRTLTFVTTTIVTTLSNAGSGGVTNRSTVNPFLASAAAANGGPTPTVALGANSGARNLATTSTVTTDQRGFPIVDAPDLGAYELQPGGVFAFSSAGLSLLEGGIANPFVVRTGGAGDATVQVVISFSSASAADINPPIDTVLEFDAGDTQANFFISTISGDAVEANETFTVTLKSPTGGATIGTPSSAVVTIVDIGGNAGDSTPPGVPVITSPAQNAIVNVKTGGTLLVTGTASDNRGVTGVTATLNGGAPVALTRTHPAAPTTPFTGNLAVQAGTNTLVVEARDGNSNFVTTPVRTFKVLRDLRMAVSGNGKVTSGFSPESFRDVGTQQTIAATAGTGAMFANWVIVSAHTAADLGISSTALQKPSLTFIFKEGLILRANFVANPYLNLAGEYSGLVRFASGPAPGPNLSTEGLVRATVTSSGAFSGKLLIDGLVLNVAGTFDHTGAARFGTARSTTLAVPRPGKPSLVVAMTMDLAPARFQDSFACTVSATDIHGDVVATSLGTAKKAFFNGTTAIVPAAFLGAANATQAYTVVMPNLGNPGAGLGPEDFPEGLSFGTATLTKAGLVSLNGIKLADGTSTTATAKLARDQRFSIFIPLYGNKGYFTGEVLLGVTVEGDMIIPPATPNFKWLRPVDLTKQHYPGGWPEIIDVSFFGGRYATVFTPASGVLRGPDLGDIDNVGEPLDAVDPVNGNSSFVFKKGLLSDSLNKKVNLSTTNVVTKVPVNDGTYTLVLSPATGTFSGTFVHELDEGVPNPLRTPFQGVIYQKGSIADGYGFFLTRTPVPIDHTGKSGTVSWLGN